MLWRIFFWNSHSIYYVNINNVNVLYYMIFKDLFRIKSNKMSFIFTPPTYAIVLADLRTLTTVGNLFVFTLDMGNACSHIPLCIFEITKWTSITAMSSITSVWTKCAAFIDIITTDRLIFYYYRIDECQFRN